ncbi:MAG: hypothetical protein ABEJ64_02285 [Candidatus Nanohaloarchaea archaeon]
MDYGKISLMVLLGSIAGLSGYLAYTRSSAGAAAVVVFTVALILFLFTTGKKRAWDSFKLLTNPFWATVFAFLAGFSYASLKGRAFSDSLVFALGAGLLGGALGMFLYKYWNIG